DYSERYWYDLGCNMTRRSRSGSGATALTVHDYDGNRLSSGLGSLASYDACGRLTGASSGKVRSIRYNEIGLPQEMGLSDGMKHSFSDCSTMREGGVLHNDSIIDGYWIGMHNNNIAFTIE
ncbi:MAG: hypothetical protein MJY72_08110, partial [Bacteroidales bacterium]|nr:hypothetical protein [Bacteroidales bacterium]